MSWMMVGGAAVTVVGGAIAKNQANKGAKAQANAAQSAADAQAAARDQARQDLMPYSQFGQQAIPLLDKLSNGDYSAFENSPDYQYALSHGLDAIDHRAAARGGLFGGGNTRDAMTFSSGLASQNLGNYRNSLFQQLGGGQSAAAGQGGFSMNAANNIGGYLTDQGNARASAYNNNAQFAAGAAGALGGMFNQYGASRTPSYSTPAAANTYSGLGGQSAFGNVQPKLGNNYANFGNWGY